jgi:hypothetical protein
MVPRQKWFVDIPFLPYLAVSLRLSWEVPMRLSRKLRKRFFYTVEAAGARVGWSRSEAYRAVRRGDIPVEKIEDCKFLLVRKDVWDRCVKQVLRGENGKARSRQTPTTVEETA